MVLGAPLAYAYKGQSKEDKKKSSIGIIVTGYLVCCTGKESSTELMLSVYNIPH